MGKKGRWFATVKKALTLDYKRGKDLKRKWLKRPNNIDPAEGSDSKAADPPPPLAADPPLADAADPPPPPPVAVVDPKRKVEEVREEETYSVALATAAAAKAAVVAADAAADVIRLTNATRVSSKLKHQIAAIKIQTTFRRYLSRKKARALKGLARLKTLTQGPSVKRQATTTLHRMQMLARVHSQIRMQRVRKSEESQARRRQAQQKHDNTTPCMGGDWNLSVKSKAEVEAKQQHRQEAAMRRDKALAYAFSRQQAWKESLKPQDPPVLDPNNPHRGWSWLERYMKGASWDTTDSNKQESSAKRIKTQSRPISNVPSSTAPSSSSVTWKTKTNKKTKTKRKEARARGRDRGDDESSAKSECNNSNSNNNNNNNNNPSQGKENVPNYMTQTKATAAKSRGIVPKKVEKRRVGTSKKRLSFAPAKAAADKRRLSGPPIKWVLPP